jgi:magnesium transporter
MITVYYHQNDKINKTNDKAIISNLLFKDFIWVDLNYSTSEEVAFVENILSIDLKTSQFADEIELSSRYIELENWIAINSNFLTIKNEIYDNEPVSFIIKDTLLISYRNADIKSFSDTVKKFKVNNNSFLDGSSFLLALFEARIDLDADLLENLSHQITEIGKSLTIEKNLEADILIKITTLQENTMIIRENIIDNQRVISSMLRSNRISTNISTSLRILIKDINSLLDHTKFNFERLEYLQNTFMGLVDLEQNKVVKIFTVVTVIFMPPTLIASIYGMNFRAMPELDWSIGYPFALILMLASSASTLLYFKKKKWL